MRGNLGQEGDQLLLFVAIKPRQQVLCDGRVERWWAPINSTPFSVKCRWNDLASRCDRSLRTKPAVSSRAIRADTEGLVMPSSLCQVTGGRFKRWIRSRQEIWRRDSSANSPSA